VLAPLAAPVPAAPGNAAQAPTPGKPVCTVADTSRSNRLIELSGLAATDTGYVAVNDSTEYANRRGVFVLDKGCRVTKVLPLQSPNDPEDLAFGKDGTVWVADIGDNTSSRANIAVWKVPPNGNTATLFKMKYPDGKHDAEALLLDANDQPIIVTRGAGASGIYTLTGPLAANTVVPLQKAGEFKPQKTGTSNPKALLGQMFVTGGANSSDRKKVVLRTYSDAYEWDVPDGDVVKAITSGKPRITPLPDEPWGEAITYSRDGAAFLTVSETADHSATPPQILQYTPATDAKPPAPEGGATPKQRNTLSWYQRMDLAQATSLIAGVGVVGVLLVVVGVIGILRARRAAAAKRARRDDGGDKAGAGTGHQSGGGGTYYGGVAAHGSEADDPDERWRDPGYAGAEYGGGQYGAASYGGDQYGGGQYGGGQYAGGYGEPHEYGPPAGYPPPGGR
jgi:hypothetical protein